MVSVLTAFLLAIACGSSEEYPTSKTPQESVPGYAVLVKRADGTIDRYPVEFKPEVVERSGDRLWIHGTLNGIAVDFYPIALNPGDRFAGFEGLETPHAREGGSPTPTVASGPPPSVAP